MFYRYEIRKINNEEILYLFLTMSYEFSKELGEDEGELNLKKRCKSFIDNNSINFKGNKVNLVIDDIVVKTLDIKDINDNIEFLEDNNHNFDNDTLITVILDNGISVEISLKEYLLGVLATNCLENLEEETLKSLCILYRTFAYRFIKEDKSINATNDLVIYRPITYYKLFWITEYNNIYNKLLTAITKTDKQFVSYEGEYILPFIHICNNGYTNVDDSYPYLQKVNSLWDMASPYYLNIEDFDFKTLEKKLGIKSKFIRDIKVLEMSDDNRIKSVKIGDKVFNTEELCEKLELNSNDITLIINKDYIRFITKGKGHGLGISQYGANELALNGCDYLQILKYYFPKCDIKKYNE